MKAAATALDDYIRHMQAVSDIVGLGADVAKDMRSSVMMIAIALTLVEAREGKS